MSYEIIKHMSFNDKNLSISITSSSSNVTPKSYRACVINFKNEEGNELNKRKVTVSIL